MYISKDGQSAYFPGPEISKTGKAVDDVNAREAPADFPAFIAHDTPFARRRSIGTTTALPRAESEKLSACLKKRRGSVSDLPTEQQETSSVEQDSRAVSELIEDLTFNGASARSLQKAVIFSKEFTELEKEYHDLNGKMRTMKGQLADTRTREEKAQVRKRKEDFFRAKARKGYEKSAAQTSSYIGDLQSDSADLRSQVETLYAEIDSLETRVAGYETYASEADSYQDWQKRSLETMKRQLEEYSVAIDKRNRRIKGLVRDVDGLKAEKASRDESFDTQVAEAVTARLNEMLPGIRQQADFDMGAHARAWQNEAMQHRQWRSIWEPRLNDMIAKGAERMRVGNINVDLTPVLVAAKAENDKVKAENDELKAENDELKAEREKTKKSAERYQHLLEDKVRSLEKENKSLRDAAQAKKSIDTPVPSEPDASADVA